MKRTSACFGSIKVRDGWRCLPGVPRQTTPVPGPLVILLLAQLSLPAAGLYRDGIGARSMALGGTEVARPQDPLGAFGANPAGAAFLQAPTAELGLSGVDAMGRFSNAANNGATLRNGLAIWPDAAFGMPLPNSPVGVFVGAAPDAALNADWRFVDAPGGADGATTYGLQRHRSRILVLRSGVGIGWAVTPQVSLGGGFGPVYNENTLQAPYIFQTQTALKGVKTLLDLNTSGVGWNGQVGLLLHPNRDLQFGFAYKSPTTVHSHGDASGNAGVQLANLGLGAARPDFHYDAEVVNHFPQMVSGGFDWQACPRCRLSFQVDWINWNEAFERLPVKLTHGNNSDLNGLVGSNAMEDDVPLNWKNQLVYRGGIEYTLTEGLWLRGGYSYGNNPVPEATLTPLTAAIMEHTLTAGLGYAWGRYQADFAYQWNIPTSRHVGQSGLLDGEYNNSTTKVQLHWIGITVSARF